MQRSRQMHIFLHQNDPLCNNWTWLNIKPNIKEKDKIKTEGKKLKFHRNIIHIDK